jgi:hypothetical protein|nr:MAG TPA: hypothetical protein [Crassvirales sp.]
MTQKEFSDQFDVLYNNVTSNQAPGLNEYEKSVFLTKAQNELVKNYFNPKSNKLQEGFDSNSKRQWDFSMLMKVKNSNISPSITIPGAMKIDPRGYLSNLPDDCFLIINETVTSDEGNIIRQVIPISYMDYTRLMSKPYKEPLKYQAWRLMISSNAKVSVVEVILPLKDRSKTGVTWTYNIRYVKKPMPIILENFHDAFGEDISLEGKNGSEAEYSNGECCELDSTCHEEILQRAVELAKVAWTSDVNATIQVGQRSE